MCLNTPRTSTCSNECDHEDCVLLQLGDGRVEELPGVGLGRDVGDGQQIGRDGLGVAGQRVHAQDTLLLHVA